ncbi:hypothetical protein HDU83_004532 [Entophlyctis luteolus]|nr:hypothetical protein HDU83_004532 [Entophlyctis luteolus]
MRARPQSLPALSVCVATFLAAANAATTFLRRAHDDHTLPRLNRVSPSASQPSSDIIAPLPHTTPDPVFCYAASPLIDTDNATTASIDIVTSSNPQSASRTVRRVEQRLPSRSAPDYNAWECISPYVSCPDAVDDIANHSDQEPASDLSRCTGEDAEDFVNVGHWLDFLDDTTAGSTLPQMDIDTTEQPQDSCDSARIDSGLSFYSDNTDVDIIYEIVSGEPPEDPVVSTKSGFVYERRLILKVLADSGKEPSVDEPLAPEQLITIKSTPKIVKPRPPTVNSVPSLLSLLQNEWDSAALESYQLKKQIAQLKQELSNALYENDAAKRVIARIIKERDSARESLAAISVHADSSAPTNPKMPSDEMEIDGKENKELEIAGVTAEIAEKMDATAGILTESRKKRKAPIGTAIAEEIQSYSRKAEISSLHSTTNPGITSIDVLHIPGMLPSRTNWILTGGNDGTVLINDFVNGSQIANVKAHGAKKVTSVAWIQHGDHAGTKFLSAGLDHTVKVWTVKESGDDVWSVGKASHVIKGHTGEVSGVVVHPCGEYAVSSSLDSSWAFLDVERGTQVSKTVHPDGKEAYTSVAMHPDGLIIGTGTSDSVVRIWELKSAKNVVTFADPDMTGRISSMSFSENGYYFATASADSCVVKLWDLRKLESFHTIDLCNAASTEFSGKRGVNKVLFDYGAGFLGVACCDTISIFKNKTWVELYKSIPLSARISDFKFGGYSKWLAAASGTERKVIVEGV